MRRRPRLGPQPVFEAASVKVNKSGEAGGRFGGRPAQLVVTNYTLRDIIRNPYVVQRYQIVGGPWTPDEAPPVGAPLPAWYDPNGPSLVTAVQEQLGLKMDATTGPVDVLVIDSAERPTED